MRRAPVLPAAAVLFAIMLAHALLETARDSLFLARLGAEQLPWAYLAIAALTLAVTGVARGGEPRRRLAVLLLGASLGTTLLAGVVAAGPAVFVLYVWTGLVAALVVPTFWLLVERHHHVGQAKRSFAAIAAGGSLGGLVGAVVAALVGDALGPAVLVALAALVLAAAGVLASAVLPAATHASTSTSTGRAATCSSRYARVLVALVLVGTVAVTIGDVAFKRALAETVPHDELAGHFGAIYAVLGALGLAVQLAVTPRLLDRVGVAGALVLLPVLLLAGAVGFAATGSVAGLVAMKLADGSLRHSVHRVACEILFVPLAVALRERARHLAEGLGQRGGQALAALLVLGLVEAGTRGLVTAMALIVLVWLGLAVLARRGYVHQLREQLGAGELHRPTPLPVLDAESHGLLVAALASPEEPEAMAALELLAERGDRIPALVLYHPSPRVVRRALALYREGRDDVVAVLARLTAHPDPAIRAAALDASSRTGCHHEQLVAALDDTAPEVRAAAVVALSAKPCAAAPAARVRLRHMLAGSTAERLALARAIARHPGAQFRPVLDQLLARREAAVTREVLAVWRDAPELADGHHLLALLADPRHRAEVRQVFVAGDGARLASLIAALEDPRTPLEVRRHLPRTLGRFRSAEAAAALVARLLREPDGTTEFRILRALGRMRADQPTLRVASAPLRAYAHRALDDGTRYAMLGAALASVSTTGPTLELLRALLAEKRAHAIERVFRVLGILDPRAELEAMHDALVDTDPARAAAARELLDHVVPAELRAPLVSLLDGALPPVLFDTEDTLLAALLRDPSDSVRCLAAHHVAERRLVALRGALVHHRPLGSSPLVTHAFDQAIARLDA